MLLCSGFAAGPARAVRGFVPAVLVLAAADLPRHHLTGRQNRQNGYLNIRYVRFVRIETMGDHS
ncbi:hypothetical protein GCM10010440_54040 [Kitasatospora cinereorecta]